MHETKVINFQKWPKWRFWGLITFVWSVFKHAEQNKNCVFIVFKAKSEPKHEKKKLCFSLLTKSTHFRGAFWGVIIK